MKEYKGQYGLPKPPIEKIIDPALIKHIKLNGKIKWNGEDSDDVGLITVKNNKVTYKEGTIVYK